MSSKLKLVFVLVVFSSCSGGGNEGFKVPDYTGVWSGNVSLKTNSCDRVIPSEFENISIFHNVNQEPVEVDGVLSLEVVLDDGIETFLGHGQVDGNGSGDSFNVVGEAHELPGFISGFRCLETLDFTYDSIKVDTNIGGSTAFVLRHSTITCSKGKEVRTCDVNYVGTAWR